jgi:hypoxanthine phosphoribosyltransferase
MRWVTFRLSNGYFFNCHDSDETAQVGHFSIVKWVLFRLTKTADARQENVRNAFRSIDRMVDAKRVLLVDDVCTTGATLEAASVALRDGGAQTVWAYTLARARGPLVPESNNPNEESEKWT